MGYDSAKAVRCLEYDCVVIFVASLVKTSELLKQNCLEDPKGVGKI